MIYIYTCKKCSSTITEVDKIPNDYLDQCVCPFCRAQGSYRYEGTRET